MAAPVVRWMSRIDDYDDDDGGGGDNQHEQHVDGYNDGYNDGIKKDNDDIGRRGGARRLTDVTRRRLR